MTTSVIRDVKLFHVSLPEVYGSSKQSLGPFNSKHLPSLEQYDEDPAELSSKSYEFVDDEPFSTEGDDEF